jgi:HlyD family secretion protein
MTSKPSNLDALRIERSQPPARSGAGWWIFFLIMLLAAGVGAWWLTRTEAVPVQTTAVRTSPTGGGRTLLNASGYVTTRLEATVSSKITGKIAEILVEEGMKVEQGQILAKLDASNARASLRLAEARLASAKMSLSEYEPMATYAHDELKRLVSLEAAKSVSQSDVGKARAEAQTQEARIERLKADVAVAERQLDEWKQQLDDTIIRAPFAGVVTTKDSQPGEMISPMSAGGFTRTGICTLVDMASLEIEVDVGESFINRVKAGQAVEATLDAYPDWKIPCKVIAIIPTADRQKATVKVRVAFEKLDPRILPQMGVKVAFQGDERSAANANRSLPVVPRNAVTRDAGRDVVWVVGDGRVERRAVTVAASSNDEITISAGLSSGETVVLDPSAKLTDGAAVTVQSKR